MEVFGEVFEKTGHPEPRVESHCEAYGPKVLIDLKSDKQPWTQTCA